MSISCNYITLLQTNIKDKTSSLNAKQLMCKSFNFYKTHKDEGKWGLSSPKQEQIVALSMQIERLKGGLKLSDQIQFRLKNFDNTCKHINQCNKNTGAQGKNKSKKAWSISTMLKTCPSKGVRKSKGNIYHVLELNQSELITHNYFPMGLFNLVNINIWTLLDSWSQ